MTHSVSVYRREGSDGGAARADCDCGWTTGRLDASDFNFVKREARRHTVNTCPHDWFEGIASAWCVKCGSTKTTERFAEKCRNAKRIYVP